MRSSGWDLARSVSAPHAARRLLADQLRAWQLSEPVRAEVAMVVTELVTNAVQHATGHAQLALHYDGVVVAVQVRDHSTAHPQLQPPEPSALHGRGLQIVNELADRWDYVIHPNGKTVWADIPLTR